VAENLTTAFTLITVKTVRSGECRLQEVEIGEQFPTLVAV